MHQVGSPKREQTIKETTSVDARKKKLEQIENESHG